MVYVVAGVIYGIAALLLIARTGVGDPNAGQTDNLDASPRWCSAAPACSAAAARSSAP